VIDTATNTVVDEVAVDSNGGVAVDPDGTRLYIPTYVDSHGALAVVDSSNYEVMATVGIGRGPRGVAVQPDGSRVYVTDKDNLTDYGGVSVVDTTSNAVVAEVRYVREVEAGGLSVHPDGTRVYVAANGYGIPVIDTEDYSTKVVPVECCEVDIGIGPPVTIVNVDIKPGSKANAISLKGNGVLPVAILTSDTFDATLVNKSTARFGATGIEAAAVGSTLKDVNRDGHLDMVLNFSIRDTGIVCGQTMASLTGRTSADQAIIGSDAIQITGCR
jgi:YVTN family beta-propeller protein